MAVNDEIYKNLAQYGGGTINERVYNYLGSLGYTGTINDRLAQYSSEGRKGWQGLIRAFGGLGWTPAALFAQGEQGVWYEPKPEYLFQDAAGTVPVTADGDPVGYMQDLSGNGNHATQETSASRPIYRTDGTLHWLEGATSWMQSPVFTKTEHWFVSYAIAQDLYSSFHGPWRFLSEGGDPTATTTNRLEDYTRGSPDRVVFSRFEASGENSDRESVLPAADTRYVGWAGYNPEASHHVGEQWDGVEQQVVIPDLSRSPGTGSISLFRAYRGNIMPGKMFGLCFRTGAPTSDPARERLNAYMRALGGIQL
jgi:hypothetical protein